MKSVGEWIADVIILVLTTLYTCYATCHITAMWKMRKNFLIALRSPLLACTCGSCKVGRACVAIYSIVFEGSNGARDVISVITAPALWVGNGALVAWMVRLVVLYDPRKRRRWGRYVNDKRVARVLYRTFVGMEAAFWVGVAVHGMDRTARVARLTAIPATLVVVVASICLAGRMRKVQDIEGLARDAHRLGAYLIVMFLVGGCMGAPGVPAIVVKYFVIFLMTSDAGLVSWTINIKPVREFLRQTDDEKMYTLSSWIFPTRTGDKANTARVACSSPGDMRTTMATQNRPRNGVTSGVESPLAIIMGFLPLKQAFGEYCQKALCSESFQFLVDASDFQTSVHAACSAQEGKDTYEEFIAITNEYIKNGSNSEINIDSRTKKEILRFQERSSFASLDVEARSEVFLQAQKEIAKMLAENLLSKFKATAEYQQVAGDLLFETT